MRRSRLPTLVLVPGALLGLLLGGCGGGNGGGDAPPGAELEAGTGLGTGPGSGILFVRAEMRAGVFPECPECLGRVPGSEEIWVMNPDGSGQTRLTNDRCRDSEPQWSPDGTRILFVSRPIPGVGDDPTSDPDVWVMNADGSGKRNLTQLLRPDGRRVAVAGSFFDEASGSSPHGIFVVDLEGSPTTRLTDDPGDVPADWR